MKSSRFLDYDHKVAVSSVDDGLYIEWQGSLDRHNYMIVKDWEELDILASEFKQVILNHRHKRLITGKL